MLHTQNLKKKGQMEEPGPRPKESEAVGVGPRRVCVVRVYLLFVCFIESSPGDSE